MIELRERAPLRGTVHDAAGAPVRSRIEARRTDDQLAMMRVEAMFGVGGTLLDAQGEFAIEGLTPGEYQLSLSDPEGDALPLARLGAAGAKGARPEADLRVEVPVQGAPPVLELVASARRRNVAGCGQRPRRPARTRRVDLGEAGGERRERARPPLAAAAR